MFKYFKRKLLAKAIEEQFSEKQLTEMTGVSGSIFTAIGNFLRFKPASYTEWDATIAIDEGFKKNHTVYSCVNLRMKSSGSVPLKVVSESGETLSEHPVHKMLQKPNSFMTASRLKQLTTGHQDTAGDAYWLITRASGRLIAMPLHPTGVRPIQDQAGELVGWNYRAGTFSDNFGIDEIIHFSYPDPNDFLNGLSPMHAAARVIDSNNDAIDFNKSSFENRGTPMGFIKVNGNFTEAQQTAIQTHISNEITGSANAGKIPALGADADFVKMGTTPAEMDFIGSNTKLEEGICSIFGVPGPMIGKLDKAQYNNIETARKIFWRDTMMPILQDTVDTLNMFFEKDLRGAQVVFDVSGIDALRESFDEQVKTARELWNMGVPLAQVNDRMKLGLNTDEIDNADVSYINGVPSFVLEINAQMTAGGEETRSCSHGHDHKSEDPFVKKE